MTLGDDPSGTPFFDRGSAGPAPAADGTSVPPFDDRASGRLASGLHRLQEFLGGVDRTRTILLLAAILALSSADSATVGASATELRQSLHIGNADIGLLVAVSAGVGALGSLPFGILVDRMNRITLLTGSLLLWGVAMIASATVSSFGTLLVVRLFLGFVTAVAGPAVASLVGDYFPGEERGKIYGYILAGELLGAGVGFFITGDVAAISWRAAFLILGIPAFFLAWKTWQQPEPVRGGAVVDLAGATAGGRGLTPAQEAARRKGIAPNPDLVLRGDPREMKIMEVVRYVVGVPTNLVLILSSAAAYFFMTGVQTFGLEFVGKEYGVHTILANFLMLVVGAGAVLGVLVGGAAGDFLLGVGRINGRMLVAGLGAAGTALFFIPPLLTRSPMTALPYITAAAFCLTAQNPVLDAARLDIMPPLLWGRAEGIRTLLRSAAQSVAPLVFGTVSDLLQGTHQGLRITFFIMLVPLAGSAVILLRGLRYYPTDVATAAASALESA
ncbi:MAG TPA: MFS transporter [Acidimicrobiales bacterium]|nr:MFS transporter [Acidimicrobiales bacterium]